MNGSNLEWSDVRVFLAIARCGTLGAAARMIGQTQPTMGRRLRALEEALGHVLFQRTSDGFVLTDEGAAVLSHAERMEEEALGFTRALAGQEAKLTGSLRVSSSDWFGVHVLTPVFARFLAKHPEVSIELVTDARRYNLARREADLVFRITPFDEPDIVQRKLMHMDYALYGCAHLGSPEIGNGEGQTLISMDSAFDHLPDVVWIKRMLPRASIVFGSNNREAQARMCALGAGFAVLPCRLGDADKRLVRFDLGEAPPGRDVWLGYHRDLKRVARLRALLDETMSLGER
ncbi:transcriptional regulator (plasmid) [Burkholderia sp. SFA1]|uniref:LysR family transcriptional regulator n=1 Tax=Caballeronia cordobensis TaxID=1353886 RepID=A0A158H0U1_CABCO|nr:MULTISPECIES: LysR family transcriptional regulator [Caballeronia]MCE4546695.1 LysR family transcriptional regulator [Caballeronia sp. PC1]MCE4572832.1 LysR family transcriptional regulator [Caballeronia sp. CLC5]BBQ01790.1 transcriptional regulator [Burkholderia sp. SFA1]SAL37956.1 LysR family transcriptional regulator [Caballeronia cordobensis]